MSVGFHKPAMVEAALALLAADPEARPLSGGQTLVPMMNLDLFRPSAIVSLNGIAELAGITTDATGAVRIGARASHAVLAASTPFKAIGASNLVALSCVSFGSASSTLPNSDTRNQFGEGATPLSS